MDNYEFKIAIDLFLKVVRLANVGWNEIFILMLILSARYTKEIADMPIPIGGVDAEAIKSLKYFSEYYFGKCKTLKTESKVCKTISVNQTVNVVFTEYGAKIYNQYHEDFRTLEGSKVFEGGSKNLQIWQIMNIFGGYIYLGNPEIPFVNNSFILED
jgi:hypothetical protein